MAVEDMDVEAVSVSDSSSSSDAAAIEWNRGRRYGAREPGSSARPSGAPFGVGATSGTGARRLRTAAPCACGASVASRDGLSDSNVASERLVGNGGRRPSGVMQVHAN